MRWLTLLVFSGCAPLAHGGRARILPPERDEIALAPEISLIGTKLTEEGISLPSLQLSLAYHRGVSERVEVGARVWGFSIERAGLESWGAAIDAKFQLRRGDLSGGGPDMAVGLSTGYHRLALGGTPEHLAFVSAPLLFGFEVGARNQLVFGPRLAWQTWWGESQKAQRHLFYGGSLGFAWMWGPRWTFTPELVFLWSPIEFGGEDARAQLVGASYLSLGLGVSFGW